MAGDPGPADAGGVGAGGGLAVGGGVAFAVAASAFAVFVGVEIEFDGLAFAVELVEVFECWDAPAAACAGAEAFADERGDGRVFAFEV